MANMKMISLIAYENEQQRQALMAQFGVAIQMFESELAQLRERVKRIEDRGNPVTSA